MPKFAIAGRIFFSIAVLAAPQAWAADANKGHQLAKENCASCHNIEKGGAFKQRPPSFQAIATYRTMDDIWARIVAPSPHAGMPEVIWVVSPDDVQDIVAYITSLDVK
jgi:mono/diheme cytochrome c family protein